MVTRAGRWQGMTSNRAGNRPDTPARILWHMPLPFAVPFALTLLLVLTVGESWPRTLAPGSGLKLAGLLASAATATVAWLRATQGVEDASLRTLAAVLCGLAALPGWPVWTVGVLPSINGSMTGEVQETRVRLDRLEITLPSRQRDGFYYWAWIAPRTAASPIAAGRVFVPEAAWRRWKEDRPETIRLRHARGLLGAQVVMPQQ